MVNVLYNNVAVSEKCWGMGKKGGCKSVVHNNHQHVYDYKRTDCHRTKSFIISRAKSRLLINLHFFKHFLDMS